MPQLHRTIVALLLALAAGSARADDYNPAFCAQVAGTLNIHWQAVGGPFAPCTSLETTNGTLAAAATGHVVMQGTTVSDFTCTFPTAYELTLLSDGKTLFAWSQALYAGAPQVTFTLTHSAGEDCFVGHWVFGGDDYVAHIWAPPFHLWTVPVLGPASLVALAAALGLLAGVALRRRRAR